MDTSFFDRAARFALQAHAGTARRGKTSPYILHPMEAAAIVATISEDEELLAAAVLHDVVEDTPCTAEDICKEFGPRVAAIVAAESVETADGEAPEDSWHARKRLAVEQLLRADRDAKIVALGDKLSNMRAIARDHELLGDRLWQRFHTADPRDHEWHYRALAAALEELQDTAAYREFTFLIDKTFSRRT